MSEGKLYNRWLIVLGAILVQLCLGAIYAWSVFRKPIEVCYGCTPSQASLPFSFVLVFFALGTILGGRLQDRYGPKIVAIIGGVLLGAGMILASFATSSLVMMVSAYGVISGIGIGFAYSCPIAAGVKWFPDKRGLITGLAVAGFGAGSFFFAPLASGLIGGTPYNLLGRLDSACGQARMCSGLHRHARPDARHPAVLGHLAALSCRRRDRPHDHR